MTKKKGLEKQPVKWCDLRCQYAESARIDALDGSCRTFQSLWCVRLENHVTKNVPCEVIFGKRGPTAR